MMEYGTGWLGREPAPWDRHRWRLNLRGDSEGGGGSGGGTGTDDNRSFPPFSRAGGGFDMSTLESLAQSRQNSLNFRRQPFQNFDIPGGQGPGSSAEFGRGGCLMPGFSAGTGSADNRDNFQRNFFGGANKEDFNDRNQNNRPFGGQRDPVTAFCADRDATTSAMIRFSQNFATQDLNNRSDRPQDGASGTAANAPFGRRVPNSPRFPPPSPQFDVGNNRQGGLGDTFNFSGLPVDPWLPSGTTATAPPTWRSPGGNQDFQPPAAGAQMYSASMALQRMSSQQNRKRPWQQLLSVVGRRSSTELPLDADMTADGPAPDAGTGGGVGVGGAGGGGGAGQVAGSFFTTKARQGRKQSKPLKHEGTDQHVDDDMTPDVFPPSNHDASLTVPIANNNPAKPASVDGDHKSETQEKDIDQSETNSDVFPVSVKSETAEDAEDKEPEIEEQPIIETYGDYSDNPLRFEELRTLFPLTLMYGEAASKDDRKWPQASVVLSTVEVQKGKSKVRYCFSAKSEEGKDHPEMVTINKIRAIEVDTDMTLKVTFIMNYTPCFFCACAILSYFFDIKSRRINIAMELKFSNLYRVHMYPCDAPSDLQTEIDRNIDGLQTLHMNGVGLQTFSGVESWYENLLNTDFLHAECKDKLQEIVDIVESDDRKEREERDEEDLCNILGL